MTIADTLRKCAYHMEPLLTRPEDSHVNRSQFICDQLNSPDLYGNLCSKSDGAYARRFLHALGMGRGFKVFSWATREGEREVGHWLTSRHLSHIEARVLWLHFAADLAEEWGDDVCIALSK